MARALTKTAAGETPSLEILSADWERRYGHGLLLAESFVDNIIKAILLC